MSKDKSVTICVIVSNISYALPHNWFIENIDSSKFKISYILLNKCKTPLEEFLLSKKIKVNRVVYFGKKNLITAFLKVFWLLLKRRPKIVHCHLFEASIVGLLAGKILFIKHRIYTRHHSDFHHIYYPKTVKYDKIINFLSTRIIAISNNVYHVLVNEEHVPLNKIIIIEHGFDLGEFYYVDSRRILNLKEKYKITSGSKPIIGVISRYMELKGIQYVIPAFKETLKKHPQALLVLANARGNYEKEIGLLLKEIPKENYREILFEKDIATLYRIFDVFIHVPIDKRTEAFGQIYIEALASGIPSVFTLSGIASDFIIDKYNALVVDYKNSSEIETSIDCLLSDSLLVKKLVKNGRDSIKKFDYTTYIRRLEDFYIQEVLS